MGQPDPCRRRKRRPEGALHRPENRRPARGRARLWLVPNHCPRPRTRLPNRPWPGNPWNRGRGGPFRAGAAAPTGAEPAGQALAEVAPVEPDDPSTVISLLEDIAEFFGIRAPRPARPEGPALAENRESDEPSGRTARPSSAEPRPDIIETAESPRSAPVGESASDGEEERQRPEALPAPESAAAGGDRRLATDPGDDRDDADPAQLAEQPGLSEEPQPLDEASEPAVPDDAEVADEDMAVEEPDEAEVAEEGDLAEEVEEPEGPETPGTPEEVAKEGELEPITEEQEVKKLTAAKPPAEESEEAADTKMEQENGWVVRNVIIANLPPGAPGARRRPLPPESYLGGVVLALGESVRLGKIREQPEEKQTAAADTVQTDAIEDTSEMPADEDEESAEEEAVVESDEDEEGEGEDDADDTWGSDATKIGMTRRKRRKRRRSCRSRFAASKRIRGPRLFASSPSTGRKNLPISSQSVP